jgi:hypothetical protein
MNAGLARHMDVSPRIKSHRQKRQSAALLAQIQCAADDVAITRCAHFEAFDPLYAQDSPPGRTWRHSRSVPICRGHVQHLREHLIGAGEQRWWDRYTQSLRRLEIECAAETHKKGGRMN